MYTLNALVQKEEGIYVARCAEIPVISQGSTFNEAVGNLRDATILYIEVAPKVKIAETKIVPYQIPREQTHMAHAKVKVHR
jgi:predicted RNase H-like HicB family nuclease